jgi:hypothetical protein
MSWGQDREKIVQQKDREKNVAPDDRARMKTTT